MNLLTQDLVKQIEIDGVLHDINYDYKTCLKIILAFEDSELEDEEKVYITLNLLYKKIPQNLEIALKKAILFLNGGKESEQEESLESNEKPRMYSFKQDANYIFNAVDSATSGKLSQGVNLHWWLFQMAFMEVPENSFFSRMLYLRAQKQKGKLNKEERAFWNKNRDILELESETKETITQEELENQRIALAKIAEIERKQRESR